MSKKILTQEDFDNNPELIEQGLKIGDEIDIPESDPIDDEDTGGSTPPPNKGRG